MTAIVLALALQIPLPPACSDPDPGFESDVCDWIQSSIYRAELQLEWDSVLSEQRRQAELDSISDAVTDALEMARADAESQVRAADSDDWIGQLGALAIAIAGLIKAWQKLQEWKHTPDPPADHPRTN